MSISEDLYEQLINPIKDRMMRTVARLVRDPDDAADAFQNALVLIWDKLPVIHRHPQPHAYILRICINASYDILRRRSRIRKREISEEGREGTVISPAESGRALISSETKQLILSAIAGLPAKQGQAVFLRIIEEESYEFIAGALGCGEAAVRSHVSKGLTRLRKTLKQVLG